MSFRGGGGYNRQSRGGGRNFGGGNRGGPGKTHTEIIFDFR